MSNNEPVYLLRKSQLDQIVQYLMQVPTGNVPGARLIQVMTALDQLTEVPPQILPILRSKPSVEGVSTKAVGAEPPGPNGVESSDLPPMEG